MSNRRGRNNVTGPTSALTSFLREHGITARHSYGGRQEPVNDQPSSPDSDEAGPSQATEEQTTPTRDNAGYVSDNLDESEEDKNSPPKKKRKLSKAVEAKLKAKEKATLNAKKGKKKQDDDDDDDEEDPYNAPSKGWISGATGTAPPIGTFQNCAQCEKKFTVTKYTLAGESGYLCHSCAKSSGLDPFKKQAAPRKRKPAAEKRVVQNFEEVEPVMSLTRMCIDIIGKHIDQVEELGDIGSVNMDQICKIVSRTRNLNQHNVRLFYGVENKSLVIYDSTNLKTPDYHTMAALNPNLERLTLHLCGQMESPALENWSRAFKNLTRLELHAPYLIHEETWVTFLRAKGAQLSGFLITNSPRFSRQCLDVLIETAPNLKELRLSELTKIEDSWLEAIAQLTALTSLDLSSDRSGRNSLTSPAVVDLLASIGKNLTLLNLSGHEDLDDLILKDGISKHCVTLDTLVLSLLPLLTDEGVATFFKELLRTNRLVHVDMSRCHELSSAALQSLLRHSGLTLETLNINGWKDVGEEILILISEQAPKLVDVDLGWCRNVNDLVIASFVKRDKGNKVLKNLNCFGCNRITTNCPKRAGLNIIGVETDILRQLRL
ncbi:RNI-like protein [Serendipita vermifera]|nr:RNI-like protein [Serendipita vermifera]